MKKIISTNNAPAAIGPYSQAVLAGNMLFISGQIPIDPKTGSFAGTTIEEQAEQVFKNIEAILTSCGHDLTSVVKTTVFLNNMENFAKVNEIYANFFKSDCPARSAVEVSALPKGALIECEAIAYLND